MRKDRENNKKDNKEKRGIWLIKQKYCNLKVKRNPMKKQFFLVVALLAGVLYSCGSANKGNTDSAEYRALMDRVQDLEFEIDNQWANSMTYGRVNLMGNPNHMIFKEDSVDVFLPFFGERHTGGGYGTDGAIEYEGPLRDLRIEENQEKNEIFLFFEGSNNGENYDFRVTIFPNGNTNTSVTSSQRNQIQYIGRVVKK